MERDDESIGLVAALWRAVSVHGDLPSTIARILAVLSKTTNVTALSVWRVERDERRVVSVASAPSKAAGAASIDARLDEDLRRLFSSGEPVPLDETAAPVWASDDGERAIGVGHIAAEGARVVVVCSSARATLPPDDALVREIARAVVVAVENDERLHSLVRRSSALEEDRHALLSRLQRHDVSEVVIGEIGGLSHVMEQVKQVAPTDVPVLILGETGSGKEVIARAVHARSRRAKGPVVRVNCGAIPTELVDSELFGHERGAFTGATTARKGWFERADGGTLFLDEVGELPPAAQVRLLRVLQDGTLERVGGHHTVRVDVRVVAATHRRLEHMVRSGTFREDLWYRLCIFPVHLPPLRERMDDLPALAAYFANQAGRRLGGMALAPSVEDLALLRTYTWPGNVRELAAVIERASILGNGKRLELRAALGTPLPTGPAATTTTTPPAGRDGVLPLDEATANHIRLALKVCQGRIEGPFGAARLLRVNPHTLRARMRKLGVDWSTYRAPEGPSGDGSASEVAERGQ